MAPFKSTQSFSVGHFLRTFRNRDGFGPAALNSPVRTDRGPKLIATGGAIETPGNGYKYHFLTANPHTFIITEQPGEISVNYIVVGGGGAGGQYPTTGNSGGGGGAGGFITGTFPNMAVGSYPVTIAAQTAATAGENGNSSVFNSITAYGGGGGSPTYTAAGNPGASGGGGGGAGPTAGGDANKIQPDGTSAIPGPLSPQGQAGGIGGPNDNTGYSGGGGGAGVAGEESPGTASGKGGDGLAAFSGDTGIPASYGTTGPSPGRWFAGGGAGGPYGGTPGGFGAGGGGDVGADPTDAVRLDALDNTGGGGAGVSAATVGKGGSGIVILRYPD
tara:strand:- start:482 stop:1474 length:993 start_codon:yes stop_codon:yes gene_type:complete